MSSDLSKQEYLKRYLENEKDLDRKRKKKPKKVHVSSLKIVDEDISLKSINFGDKVEEDEDDEKPVVAEIIDERPIEEKIKELYESSRWKKIDDESSRTDSVAELRENGSKLDSESLKGKTTVGKNSDKSGQNNSKRIRHDSDSDLSPPRTQNRIGRKRHDSSDLSPERNIKRNRCDSEISPPRTHKQRKGNNKQDSDSDISPPRTHKQRKGNNKQDSDSDISPPRHNSIRSGRSKRHDSNSDVSPPHLKNKSHLMSRSKNESRSPVDKKRRNSDSDISPPRSTSELSNKDKAKKLGKTLSGLKAGLQNSKTLQKEILELREREKNQLNTLEDEVSGKNATTIIRDRKTGLKRDLNQEQQVKNEEDKKTKEYQQKYAQWGKGIEQTMEKKDKFLDEIYEMSKPMARYKDDEDLDERLKSIIHDEDPMSEYIKKKRQKDTPKYPVYTGPAAPPNRFGILPGYRWDGVDRSNGFEKKYFEKVNKSKAVETEAYLWSVQDM